VSVLAKARVDAKVEIKELKEQVESLEATTMKNKDLVNDAQALLNRDLDLCADLKMRDEKLEEAKDLRKKAEEACKEAEELAEKNAKRLEDSRAALLACMQEAKVSLDAVFAKGGSEPSEVLLDAEPVAFLVWLQAELDQFTQLLNNVSDFGAYGATLAVVSYFQAAGCDHLKKLGHVSHNFPSIDDVRSASRDCLCKNVVARFLMKFWMEGGGRALAFSEEASGTHEVYWGFCVIAFCSFC
jgi:hypothetical protein